MLEVTGAYLKGSLWLLLYVGMLWVLGGIITRWKKKACWQMMYGYLLVSAWTAIIGLPVQLLNLSWWIFYWLYLISLVVFLAIGLLIALRNGAFSDGRFSKERFARFWHNHFFVLIVIASVSVLIFLSYPDYWLANQLDDGYYITKIAMLPYMEKPYMVDPATGFGYAGLFNTYSLNVFESEMAVYVHLLRIPVTLFCRGFLAVFHLFLFACCILCMADLCLAGPEKKGKKIRQESTQKSIANVVWQDHWNHWNVSFYAQFATGVLWILLLRNQYAGSGFFELQDQWQANSAMFYGSSVVRCFGIFLLILPFAQKKTLSLQVVILVCLIALGLLSHSTIALPLVLCAAISYVLALFILSGKRQNWILAGLLLAGWLLTSLLAMLLANTILQTPETTSEMNAALTGLLQSNLTFPVFWMAILLLAAGFVRISSRAIRLCILVTFLMAFFCLVPGFNGLLLLVSQHGFVIKRLFTSIAYFAIALSFCILLVFFLRIPMQKQLRKMVLAAMSVVLWGNNLLGFYFTGSLDNQHFEDSLARMNPRTILSVWKNNPYLMPEETYNLGLSLNRLTAENGPLKVLVPAGRISNQVLEQNFVLLRALAPDIYNVSALVRYPVTENSVYANFSNEDLTAWMNFFDDPASISEEFLKVLEVYDIDALVLNTTPEPNAALEELGFTRMDTVLNSASEPSLDIYLKKGGSRT